MGPFDTESQASAALRKKAKTATFNVNVSQSSGLVDVSGMTGVTRIRINNAQGAEVQMEIKKSTVTQKWWGQCVIPAGTIHVTYYE